MAMDSREILSSEARKKIDCVKPIENVSWSENLGTQQQGSRCDLRKSLAWDSAFFTSPGVLDVEELFTSLNLCEDDIELDVKGKCTNRALPSTSFEPERTYESNGRRSLAWNTAFFTDPGVLNAEELFLVNSGFSKTGVHRFPETNKQLWKSVDSSSTTQSSRFSVTSIENDLFGNLRTALRQSASGHDARLVSVKSEGVGELKFLKEPDTASARKKLKPLPPSGRQRTNVQRHKRIQKEPSGLTPQPKKPDKFMCGTEVTAAVSMNKALSPPEYAKPKNTSAGFETGRNLGTLKNRCSEEQTGSAPIFRSSHTGGWRRVVDSRLTASDSSFKTPPRLAFRKALDPRVSQKSRKTPTELTLLSNIAAKDIRPLGLRLPLPKIGFLDSENAQKENKEPNLVPNAEAENRRNHRKLPQVASPVDGRPSPLGGRKTASPIDGRPSPLGHRKTATSSANAKCSKIEGMEITKQKTGRNVDEKIVCRRQVSC